MFLRFSKLNFNILSELKKTRLVAGVAVEFVTPLSRTTTLVRCYGRYVTKTAELAKRSVQNAKSRFSSQLPIRKQPATGCRFETHFHCSRELVASCPFSCRFRKQSFHCARNATCNCRVSCRRNPNRQLIRSLSFDCHTVQFFTSV